MIEFPSGMCQKTVLHLILCKFWLCGVGLKWLGIGSQRIYVLNVSEDIHRINEQKVTELSLILNCGECQDRC